MEGASESRSNSNRPYNRQAAGSASRIAGFKALEIRHLQQEDQDPLDTDIDEFEFHLYDHDDHRDDDDQDDADDQEDDDFVDVYDDDQDDDEEHDDDDELDTRRGSRRCQSARKKSPEISRAKKKLHSRNWTLEATWSLQSTGTCLQRVPSSDEREKVFEDSVKDYVTKEIPEGFSLVYWGLFYDRRELQKSKDSCQMEESPDDGICQCQGVKIRFWVQLKKLKYRSAFDNWLDPVVGIIEQIGRAHV